MRGAGHDHDHGTADKNEKALELLRGLLGGGKKKQIAERETWESSEGGGKDGVIGEMSCVRGVYWLDRDILLLAFLQGTD